MWAWLRPVLHSALGTRAIGFVELVDVVEEVLVPDAAAFEDASGGHVSSSTSTLQPCKLFLKITGQEDRTQASPKFTHQQNKSAKRETPKVPAAW